ncbi:hypothetical protein LFT45_04470 [Arthrobacter sp. FW305-BF8]|uniref:hypothetical protein n=1 Tax=Arthrobacter sp. FW305-BF8 TaxID=2879617 RepID=UPI001F3BDFEB|nr:hypothetical protein [Arthrobacter sp. FW305-BF8]UKA55193.1 hypothetical protein LFT45_04470 [Arthrobacter sp. FW305-BF8]
MSDKAKDARARRVVFGLDDQNRSTIASDGYTETRLVTEAWTLNHLWEQTSVPSDVLAENTLTEKAANMPPSGGYKFMVTTYAPDSEWDYEAGYRDALAAGGIGDSLVDSDIPGLHATDTVDIGTIISGELWAISETGETLLRPGDTWVMRGTKHAWQNRGDVPAVAAVIMIGATRSS